MKAPAFIFMSIWLGISRTEKLLPRNTWSKKMLLLLSGYHSSNL